MNEKFLQNIFGVLLTFAICGTSIKVAATGLELLNDKCKLSNGQNGKCLRLKDCANALKQVQIRDRPNTCGYDGLEPIVCCKNKPLPVGTISQQKCNDTYFPLAPAFKGTKSQWVDEDGDPIGFGFGGFDAKSKQYTHMAALGYGEEPNITWACGGSLISDQFVMTAAHCIESHILGRVQVVRLGDLDLRLTNDSADPQDFNISRVFVHPEYAPPSVYNDIALLELDRKAKYTAYVRPACLHLEGQDDFSEKIITATGWGITSFDGYQADHLQEMFLRNVSIDKCREAFKDTSKRRMRKGIDKVSQLCVGASNADTCQGDSGGPLQVRSFDTVLGYSVVGITSFGKPCGLTKAPGVYTKVSHYIGWIEPIVWPNAS